MGICPLLHLSAAGQIIEKCGPRGENKNRICFEIKQDRCTTFHDLPFFLKLSVNGKSLHPTALNKTLLTLEMSYVM